MEKIQVLRDIANDLGFNNIVKDLNKIEESNNGNSPLILPLVGEFSSGKTTLVNALTDSKKLETATKPTTATIYEVHFGSHKCCAKVLTESGEEILYSEISELKNENLNDAKVVTVFDTSTKVPDTTVLVDTPGLSSPDPKHKQTLVEFLPNADGILLVSDINQQITKSLIDFVNTVSLSKRPVFLVLTKCDTKSAQDVEDAKKYISENIHIGIENISCVSANNDDLSQLYDLFEKIKEEKNDILIRVNEQRIKIIAEDLTNKVDELLASIEDDKEVEDTLRKKKYELEKLHRNIDGLLDNLEMDLSDTELNTCRKFEDIVFDKLESLVSGSNSNYDSEAISIINNTSTLVINEYKDDVRDLLREKAKERKNSDSEVNLRSLQDVDLSSYSVNGLTYNLSLNNLGHEFDGAIATGVKVVGTIAAVAVAAPVIGGAAVETVAAETALDVADTASDIGSIISNQRTTAMLKNNNQQTITNSQNTSSKGIVESMVGFVTERTMAKPQRRRAIHDYMDSVLLPGFKSEVKRITRSLLSVFKESLHKEASDMVSEMTNAIEDLKRIRAEQKSEFENKKTKLRNYKNTLLTY
ncbi:MAG: dynamin family protein [Paludibacteraceae bacterium]|nr:dynamin family protein [Paludibacteraceae bacterium]